MPTKRLAIPTVDASRRLSLPCQLSFGSRSTDNGDVWRTRVISFQQPTVVTRATGECGVPAAPGWMGSLHYHMTPRRTVGRTPSLPEK